MTTTTRTQAVETLAARLYVDLCEADEIIVCLLSETIDQATEKAWKDAVTLLRSHAERYRETSPDRAALLRCARILEQHREQP